MPDLLDSPKRMLRWARHRIAELEGVISAFAHEKPWAIVSEIDSDGVTDIFKVKFTKRLSEDLPHIVFDAVNNLRPVLDQTAFAIAVRHIGNNSPTSAKFPFGPTETDMVNNAKGGCKDLPPAIVSLFKSFKPYKGGNKTLWAMNELCNTPKHKLLRPLNLAGGQTIITPTGNHTFDLSPNGEFERFEFFPPRWDRNKHELVFAYMPSRFHFKGDFNVTFTVALDDVDEVIRGQHPVTALNAMAGVVESILVATEAECRQLGLAT
jgi:hypothetical protein